MAIKIRIPKRKAGRGFDFAHPAVRAGVATFIIICMVLFGIFAFYYIKYQKIVDARMRGPIFSTSAQLYAAPEEVDVGEKITADQVASELRRAGYTPDSYKDKSRTGTFVVKKDSIEITPGPESYHSSDGAVIRFAKGKIDSITGTGGSNGQALDAYDLEPQLVTALFDTQARAKRRLVTYDEIPKVLVDAVLSIEDRRFFQHSGVNYFRFAEAAWADLRAGKRGQGGSTITMQIARGFFLSPEKTIKRKMTEMLIAIELEQRFTKKQIFELYANEVNMGQRGSFTINGFAEAARAYFNKDIKELTLPEAALLAGLIQAPSRLSPYKHPERALERRNLVLEAMLETGAITREQADKAKATPLKLAPMNVEASDAPYFVDLVKDVLSDRYSERDLNEHQYRIYTTLDPELQRVAAEVIDNGIKHVDEQVEKLRTKRVKVGTGKKARYETKVLPGPQAQVAMVVLDPHTGEVLALVGGRNYGQSQLDHAVSKRPTGSIFKPFVYAAAVDSALEGAQQVFTAASTIEDEPTTFIYGDQVYEPRNYKEEYMGTVTARYALAHSLNNATVKLAEEVGYERVAALARTAGITSVRPTPAMALGAYDATPLEMAGAYTVFANGGVKVSPMLIKSVRDAHANVVDESQVQMKTVLDPRVAYVVTNMMEAVINNGTAAGVRTQGFTAPAAGKTGTSHDGWFAGYTSNLLCIVWIGFDDYTDLRLSGATTAAPIWGDFMKRAVALPRYSNPKPFSPPQGVVVLQLDKVTNRIATGACPDDYTAAFIAGTEPKETCDQATGVSGVISKIGHFFGVSPKTVPPPQSAAVPASQQQPLQQNANGNNSAQVQPPPDQKKKKGFFGKVFGALKGDDSNTNQQQPK